MNAETSKELFRQAHERMAALAGSTPFIDWDRTMLFVNYSITDTGGKWIEKDKLVGILSTFCEILQLVNPDKIEQLNNLLHEIQSEIEVKTRRPRVQGRIFNRIINNQGPF